MYLHVVKNRKVWYAVSATLVVAAVLALGVLRLHPGIDFTGGSLMELRVTGEMPATAAVAQTLTDAGFTGVTVQTSGTDEFLVRLESLDETRHQEALSALAKTHTVEELRFDSVGPVIGQELSRNAALGVGVSLLLIALYVTWMFRGADSFVSSKKIAFLTIVKTAHDVLISVGAFAVFGALFGYEANVAFVAAVLTVLGYSINDGVVVLDRTRENLKGGGAKDLSEVVELSANQTLARSINTSVTVFLALLSIFLLGGESTRPFALVLLIGVAVGTYSSIFLVSPLLVEAWPFTKKNA